MKVKDLKIKIEFTDGKGEHQELTIDTYDHIEFNQQNGYHMRMDMLGFVFPESNNQSRLDLKVWKDMDKYEDLVQKDKL